MEVAPKFIETRNAQELKSIGVKSVSELIMMCWASITKSLKYDSQSALKLMYAAYKNLEKTEGRHWRLVFEIKASNNVTYIALDVAVLSNGENDVFRSIQTRRIQDINVLFNVSISADIAVPYLKESFLHNSPIVLSENFGQTPQTQQPDNVNLNVILSDLGNMEDSENIEENVQIGSSMSDITTKFD